VSDQTAVTGTAVKEIAALAHEARAVQEIVINGATFTDRPLHRADAEPRRPEALEFYTLAAFADYLKAEAEGGETGRPFVHVATPTRVDAISKLFGEDEHLRRNPARAVCKSAAMHGFAFNSAVTLEMLAIALQTCFEPGRGHVNGLRQFCASVRSSSEIGVADDGVSQQISAKSGVAAVLPTPVVNPWSLAPWRTFSEIPQPESPFILRFIKGDEPRAGLFETGDARWQVEAVQAIATKLRELLGEGWTVLG
jgi:hypothetical protein